MFVAHKRFIAAWSVRVSIHLCVCVSRRNSSNGKGSQTSELLQNTKKKKQRKNEDDAELNARDETDFGRRMQSKRIARQRAAPAEVKPLKSVRDESIGKWHSFQVENLSLWFRWISLKYTTTLHAFWIRFSVYRSTSELVNAIRYKDAAPTTNNNINSSSIWSTNIQKLCIQTQNYRQRRTTTKWTQNKRQIQSVLLPRWIPGHQYRVYSAYYALVILCVFPYNTLKFTAEEMSFMLVKW